MNLCFLKTNKDISESLQNYMKQTFTCILQCFNQMSCKTLYKKKKMQVFSLHVYIVIKLVLIFKGHEL